MKLEPTFTSDNVLFCVFAPGEDTSEAKVLPELTAQGYAPWGETEANGVDEAVKFCCQEGFKDVVLCPFGWRPEQDPLPTKYTVLAKK